MKIQLELLVQGRQTVVSRKDTGNKNKRKLTPELARLDSQTDWERLEKMSDEEATQNALDDPDNLPLEENTQGWEVPSGKVLGLNFFPEEEM
ncbi:hypothetical protein [Euhalothece natronophila]|uniref:hypothetical protein n=1 Tax=Euhalothece natronophila TaxID=577489 RepID=UPI001645D8D9|nr:hypothetical protein [Euhalothece natronophila]